MKHTIKMVKSKSHFRMYEYELRQGNELVAVCTDPQSARKIQALREQKVRI